EPAWEDAIEPGGDDAVPGDDVRVLRHVEHLERVASPSHDHALRTAPRDDPRDPAVRVGEEAYAGVVAVDADDAPDRPAPSDHGHARPHAGGAPAVDDDDARLAAELCGDDRGADRLRHEVVLHAEEPPQALVLLGLRAAVRQLAGQARDLTLEGRVRDLLG